MKIIIDGWAWLPLSELKPDQIEWLKKTLTITQRVSKEYKERSKPKIVNLWVEDIENNRFGIPREYFFDNLTKDHQVVFGVSQGDKWPARVAYTSVDGQPDPEWIKHIHEDPSVLTFFDTEKNNHVTLKPEQQQALDATMNHLQTREASGGLVQAPTAWGKSVWSLALIRSLKVKTAVLVHREFLMDQWKKRIAQYLPDAKVGTVYGTKWKDVDDAHIVLIMVETLSSWVKNGKIRPELANMFGLVLTDEVHRIGAPSWCLSIPLFNAAYRVGVSASPKRSDGLDKAFFYNIGQKIFTGTQITRMPKIRRVWSKAKINNPRLNQGLISMELAFRFISSDAQFNQDIVDQIKAALSANRKIIVFSLTVKHLTRLKEDLDNQYRERNIKTDFYIGGMSQSDREEAEKADVIFATYQMCKDSLDIPALDTVVLAGPVRNPQQPAGRALRDFPDKKDPVIVDIRADEVPVLKDYSTSRDMAYKRLYNDNYIQPKLTA